MYSTLLDRRDAYLYNSVPNVAQIISKHAIRGRIFFFLLVSVESPFSDEGWPRPKNVYSQETFAHRFFVYKPDFIWSLHLIIRPFSSLNGPYECTGPRTISLKFAVC